MKVLVTGGTGFVGRAIVARLHGAGHAVRLLVRQPASPRAAELATRHDAELAVGDVLNPSTLTPAVQGTEAVIHLVGIISELGRNTFEQAHTVATHNVVQAASEAGVKRYLHMSALGTRPQARSRYHQTKWKAEEAVRRSALSWTIFRPSLIYGAEDQFVQLFTRLSRWSPLLPVIGSGRARLQPIEVDDVAAAFVGALAEPRAVGMTFDLCGPDRLTFPGILNAIGATTGRRRWRVRIPLWLARPQAALFEFVFPRFLGRAAPLNRDQLVMLEEDNVGDPWPATELFGLALRPFRDGVERCLAAAGTPPPC